MTHRPEGALPTRRDVLACVGCLSLGLWRPWAAESPTAADDATDGASDEPPRTPADVAAFCARWEIAALTNNWPARYRQHFRWSRAIRWLPDYTVCYGVGAGIHETAVDLALARIRLAELGRLPILAEHVVEQARVREVYEKAAKERQKAHANTAPGKPKTLPANLPEVNGDARDLAGKAVGVSGRTIDYATLSAWCIVVAGADDDRLRYAMKGLTPVWWRDFDADFGSAADAERALRRKAARRERRRRARPSPWTSRTTPLARCEGFFMR